MTTATVNGTPTQVSQIASFNLSSGAPNWTYQAPTGATLTIIAATQGNGLIVKIVNGSQPDTVVSLDSTGTPTVIAHADFEGRNTTGKLVLIP